MIAQYLLKSYTNVSLTFENDKIVINQSEILHKLGKLKFLMAGNVLHFNNLWLVAQILHKR